MNKDTSNNDTQSERFIIVLTTCSDQDGAHRIASALIEGRLAACVQIDSPMTSVYRWENKLETSLEIRLIIKTRKSLEEEAYRLIQSLHSYDVPQILTVPIQNGSDDYLNWLGEETDS